MSAVGVHLDGLTRRFGALTALDGLDLEVAPGEMLALLGPSGCGKTTALRLLGGFDYPDGGRIMVGGRDVTNVPANRRDMGMVFQAYSLFPNMDARRNVEFGLRMRKMGAAQRRARAEEVLDLVGLADHAGHYPHQMSGGQQQLGITTLFVTHDQAEALSIADRVGVMHAGHLEQLGSPDEVYDRPATPFVAEFVGTMNRVAGRVLPDGRLEVLGSRLSAIGPDGQAPGSAVEVLVRPEALEAVADPNGHATVVERTFLGSLTRMRVALDDGVELLIDVASRRGLPEPGARVGVRVTSEDALIGGTQEPPPED